MSSDEITGALLFLVFIVAIVEVFRVPKPGPWTPSRSKCEKDESKSCPSRWRVTATGGMETDAAALLQCCKVREQLEAIERLSRRQ